MPEPGEEGESPSLKLNDLVFILLRQKRKIVWSTLVGLCAAALVYFLHFGVYESQAKLLVRYVLDKSAVDAADLPTDKTLGSPSENLINSEVEILTSWDLAAQVVEKFSIERFFPKSGGKVTMEEAARSILLGLKVTPPKASNVILVSYKNRDPILARLVLEEIVRLYFEKHLEVHRSAGAFEFVTQETDQVWARLQQTEAEAKALKTQSGIISLAGTTSNLDLELSKCQRELLATESERAEQSARIAEIEKGLKGESEQKGAVAAGTMSAIESGPTVQRYQALAGRLVQLRQAGLELLARFTPENRLVKLTQAQIDDLQRQMREMESRYPGISAAVSTTGAAQNLQQPNLGFERARLAGINARATTLKGQLQMLQTQAERLLDIGPKIAELDRKKEVQEANYKYFEASREKSRIDEALDPSKMPNISVVQKPSPALRTVGELKKILIVLAGGGAAAGVALALLMELVVDQTVRRPIELEKDLRIPLLLSIPYFMGHGRWLPARPSLEMVTGSGPETQVLATWDIGHCLRPFAEAIRDRLALYFEINRIHHKPKLIALTACASGAGSSSVASSLASAFSDAGDCKVLLVDMNGGDMELHPFFRGMPVTSLAEVLKPGAVATPAVGNLYLATASSPGTSQMQLIPKRFYELIPRLRASQFDYIIFDMPPMGETSATVVMAGFMDKVLLLIEAETSDREQAKRAYSSLAAAKANVSAIFNKIRS